MELVKPACVALSKAAFVHRSQFNPASKDLVEKLAAVDKVLTPLGPGTLTKEIGAYVFYPIRHLLQQESLSDASTEFVLKIISKLYKVAFRSSVTLESLTQVLAVVSYLTSPDPPGTNTKYLAKSSEFRGVALGCIESLLEAGIDSNVAYAMRTSPTLPFLVTLCLDSFQVDSEVAVAKQALETLKTVLFGVINDPDNLVLLAPGVFSRLMGGISDRYGRRHSRIKESAVDLLKTLVVATYADSLPPSPARTKERLENADDKIAQSLEILISILKRTDKDYLALVIVGLAKALADSCWSSLPKSQPFLIDIQLAGASLDLGQAQIESAKQLQVFGLNKQAAKVANSRLSLLLEGLPGALSSQDEKTRSGTLSALRAGAHYYPSRAFCNQLLDQLADGISLRQSPSVLQGSYSADLWAKSNQLTALGIDTDLSLNAENEIHKLLGTVAASPVGVDFARELLERLELIGFEQPLVLTEYLWFARCVLENLSENSVFMDFLDYSLSILETSSDGRQVNPSVAAATAETLCVLYAKLGPAMKEHLVYILCPTMDLLGVAHPIVHRRGLAALQILAKSCEHNNAQDFVVANKDYIVDGISQKLRALNISPATPLMLAALVKLAGVEIVPYLDDLIGMLTEILDHYHGYAEVVAGIFSVFTAVVHVTTSSSVKAHRTDKKTQRWVFHRMETKEDFEEAHRVPITAPELDLEPELEPEPEPEPEKDDSESEPEEQDEWDSAVAQGTYLVLEKIFEYIDRFLSHESPRLRRGLLELIKESIPVLATSKSKFEPLLYKTWPLLVERTRDKEIFVNECAFKAIAELSYFASDAMIRRIEPFWRVISERDILKLSKMNLPPRSVEKRYINAVADCLGVVIDNVYVYPEVLEEIIEFATPMWKRNEAADLRASLERVAPDAVWFGMLKGVLEPPNEIFVAVRSYD